jgi:geranylgeranyl pyrophosphate synthase
MLEFFRDIKQDLQVVERELNSVVRTQNTLLTETSTHLLNAGGKRLFEISRRPSRRYLSRYLLWDFA